MAINRPKPFNEKECSAGCSYPRINDGERRQEGERHEAYVQEAAHRREGGGVRTRLRSVRRRGEVRRENVAHAYDPLRIAKLQPPVVEAVSGSGRSR